MSLKLVLLTKIKIKVIPLHILHTNRVLKSNVKQKINVEITIQTLVSYISKKLRSVCLKGCIILRHTRCNKTTDYTFWNYNSV